MKLREFLEGIVLKSITDFNNLEIEEQDEVIEDSLFEKIQFTFCNHQNEETIWEIIIGAYVVPLPSKVFKYLYENRIAIEDLVHSVQGENEMLLMSKEHVEPAIHVATSYYQDETKSANEFEVLLKNMTFLEPVLYSLVRIRTQDSSKREVLKGFVSSANNLELITLFEIQLNIEEAESTKDSRRLIELFNMNDSRIYLSLLKNSSLSEEHVSILSNINDIKRAKEIRNSARLRLSSN